jgi:hypothetical protein
MERKISIGMLVARERRRFTELAALFRKSSNLTLFYSHWKLRGDSKSVAMLCGSEYCTIAFWAKFSPGHFACLHLANPSIVSGEAPQEPVASKKSGKQMSNSHLVREAG